MSLNDHKISRTGDIDVAQVDKPAVDARSDKRLAEITRLREEQSVREEELNTRESTLDRRESELGQGLAAVKTREKDVGLRELDQDRKAAELAEAITAHDANVAEHNDRIKQLADDIAQFEAKKGEHGTGTGSHKSGGKGDSKK